MEKEDIGEDGGEHFQLAQKPQLDLKDWGLLSPQ